MSDPTTCGSRLLGLNIDNIALERAEPMLFVGSSLYVERGSRIPGVLSKDSI